MSNSKINLPLQLFATTAVVLLILFGLYWGGRQLFYEPVKTVEGPAGRLPVAVSECKNLHTDFQELALDATENEVEGCGLDISGNKYEGLFRSITERQKLVIVKANDNLIKEIPDWIGEMRVLRVLELRNNQIRSVPEGIRELRALEVLDLRGNPLSPQEIERTRALVPQAAVLF